LARAVNAVPLAAPLPDPLPDPPAAPISYLGSLAAKIQATAPLSYEEQGALVFDLKRGLRDPETADDTRTLLKIFRKRRDLFASIAEDIDELCKGVAEVPSAKGASSKLEQVAGPIDQALQLTKVQFNRKLLTFVTKWSLACFLSEAIGFWIGFVIHAAIRVPIIFAFPLFWGAPIGMAVGYAQYILLQRRINYSKRWILLTTIGWVTAFIIEAFLMGLGRQNGIVFASTIWASVAVGILQWLILRRSVSRAGLWILIVSGAGVLGRMVFQKVALLSLTDYVVFGAIAGAISGVITGFGLGILLRAQQGTRSSF